jgi:hypothetical protein
MSNTKNYEIETSITLDYRKSAWGLERIVLDGVANHLPEDSNGTNVAVSLKQDGQYVPLKEADPQKKTEEIMFEDDGSGYDARMLSILFSSKGADELSVGQFGEGLKLVAAAALRNGVDIEYHSKNWIANPFSKPERIGGHDVEKLCFDIKENGFNLDGSRTVIRNPSDELMGEVYQIPDKVLALNDDYEVLSKEFTGYGLLSDSKAYPSKIVRLGNGRTTLFIKGVKVQDSQSIFSYDLGLNNITPDRIFADRDRVLDSIENLLKNYASPEEIKTVMAKAFVEPDGNYQEFQAFYNRNQDNDMKMLELESIEYDFEPIGFYFGKDGYTMPRMRQRRTLTREEKQQRKEAELEYKAKTNPWALAFKEMFGESAVLESNDVNENRDAKLMGYRPVKINSGVAGYLRENGIKDVYGLTKEREYKWIDRTDLTESERSLVDKVGEINQVVLDEPTPVDVRIYQGLFTKAGREIESSTGVHVTEPTGEKYIGVKRDRLGSLEDFTETYLHELGHNVTGAGDADRRFTEFFVKALSKLAIHYMKKD